jgi:LPXTG-motif cell wall-anchored protein
MVHSRSFWQSGVTPNPATYSPTDGTQPRGSASPAMGAVYSLLALKYYFPLFLNPEQALTVQLIHSLPDLTLVTLPLGPLGIKQSTTNVPVIVGATFGTLGGLLLIAVIAFFLRRRRRLKSAHIDGPSEESRQRQPKPSNVTPFTDEVGPFMTQDQSTDFFLQKPSKFARDEKFPTTPTDSSVAGRSSLAVTSRDGENTNGDHDGNLREEVEQLRRVVETLQVQQPGQLVYQQGSPPDEPPPMYYQQPAGL